MEPFWDLLGKEWSEESPNQHIKDQFKIWCDIDTKSIWIVLEGNPSLDLGGILHCGDLQFEGGITLDPEFVESCEDYKCGYLLKDGKCFTIGNDHHEMGWWICDDWIWNMLLWELNSDGTIKQPHPQGLIPCYHEDGSITYEDGPSQEEIEQLLIEQGFTRNSEETRFLESCLDQ
jgi:hypothetical protein